MAPPLVPGQQMCVHCVYALMIPATRVDARCTQEGQDVAPNLRLNPGLDLVAAVRRARDEGYSIDINQQHDVGVYAELTFHGDTVCVAHLWISIDQARNPRARVW